MKKLCYFDRARALLAKQKRHHLVAREFIQGLVDEMAEAARQIIRAEKARDEYLATINSLSRRRDELIDEVAALRAQLERG